MDPTTARIEYLADHPEHIRTLAQWHHAQFGYLSPGVPLEQRVAQLQTHLHRGQIPTTFVALSGPSPVGCASLIAHDMDTRLDLSPWLASVYVVPEHRRTGIGTALVGRVVQEARALGLSALYLYTPDRETFYSRLGWSVIDRPMYRGYRQALMCLRLVAGRP